MSGRWFRIHRPLLRQISLLLVLPILMAGSGYALFSQQLSIDATTSIVGYVSNQYTTMTYTKSATFASGVYTYRMNPFTIFNKGVTSITAWQVTFVVPNDTTAIQCPTSVTCSINNATHTVTITRTVTIAAGASSIINTGNNNAIRFTSAVAAYTPQNITISATFSTAYQTIAGLTVVATAGPKSGGAFPLSITITNNSGQSISGWRVTVPTTKTCTSTVPVGITYTCTASVLTYTGSAISIANGAQYTFATTVTTTMTTWNTSGAAVKGRG